MQREMKSFFAFSPFFFSEKSSSEELWFTVQFEHFQKRWKLAQNVFHSLCER